MLGAKTEHSVHPELSGLKLLAKVIKNLAAFDFSADVSLLISADNLIDLDKGEANISPIAIGIIMG